MSAQYGAKQEGLKKLLPFPRRISYLIDPEGRVAQAYEVSDAAGHAEAVLCDLSKLHRKGTAGG